MPSAVSLMNIFPSKIKPNSDKWVKIIALNFLEASSSVRPIWSRPRPNLVKVLALI